jgi:hypothetical protein
MRMTIDNHALLKVCRALVQCYFSHSIQFEISSGRADARKDANKTLYSHQAKSYWTEIGYRKVERGVYLRHKAV